jgi:hypothetical protein
MMSLSNLRGRSASILLGIVGAFAFSFQGYDQAIMNGLLTLPDWVATFPEIDTTNTEGAERAYNAKVQGKQHIDTAMTEACNVPTTNSTHRHHRHRRRHL